MKLKFDNCFFNNLPADADLSDQRHQVFNAAYSKVQPTKTSKPALLAFSTDVAQLLGITLDNIQSTQFVNVFTGNQLIDGMQPYAMCYGGHQFGQWAGQLGDGRAINLGEIETSDSGHLTLQLKGAGATPYSRSADGLAVLRSSIREFLCSEAMHYLGIPTTRALSLCLTGDNVIRDMFYDGNAKAEAGAIVCRVSPSFMRFGTFQLPASRGDLPLLKQLVEHCISHDFSHLVPIKEQNKALDTATKTTIFTKEIYLNWFSEVCDRTCALIVNWQRVGFVHGVMNTDNMSIIGETIDYGPYGWLDSFDLQWTPNTTDAQHKRYCFGDQGRISQWNLFQLANAIYPLIEDAAPLQNLLDNYAQKYQQQWLAMMRQKLGLLTEQPSDLPLITSLEQLLTAVETDMTLFYRLLAKYPLATSQADNGAANMADASNFFADCYYQTAEITPQYQQQLNTWLARYVERINLENDISKNAPLRAERMNKVNPKFVLRNYLAQQAIDAGEQGDYNEIQRLQKLLTQPYAEQQDNQRYAQKRPEWARNKAGCGMLSCSS